MTPRGALRRAGLLTQVHGLVTTGRYRPQLSWERRRRPAPPGVRGVNGARKTTSPGRHSPWRRKVQPGGARGDSRRRGKGQRWPRRAGPDTEGRHAGGATTCRSLNNYRPAVHVAREATTPHLGTHTDVLLKVFKGLLQTSARATSRHPVTATARQQRQQGARAGHHESHILATQLPDDQGRL